MSAVQALRSAPLVLADPPNGVIEYEPGRCCWCGAELRDKAKAIRYGRTYCYPDREGRDCVGERTRSVVWNARDGLRIVAKRDGRHLACADCGVVVEEYRDGKLVSLQTETVELPKRDEHGRLRVTRPTGVPAWEADHEIPLEDGGPHTIENLRCRCVPCHRRKTAREATDRAGAAEGRCRMSAYHRLIVEEFRARGGTLTSAQIAAVAGFGWRRDIHEMRRLGYLLVEDPTDLWHLDLEALPEVEASPSEPGVGRAVDAADSRGAWEGAGSSSDTGQDNPQAEGETQPLTLGIEGGGRRPASPYEIDTTERSCA